MFLILFVLALAAGGAEKPVVHTCAACRKSPLVGTIWKMPDGRFLCDPCSKLPTRCTVCSLPLAQAAAKTTDGRLFCAPHAATAVLEADKAREIFEATRRQLVELLGPRFALKSPEVTVNLFDVDYWSERGGIRGDQMHKVGFSSTRPAPIGKFTHVVILLSGHTADEIAATCAHEYTHLWVNENTPAGRAIEGDTHEAICELVAWKLMGALGKKAAQEKIVKSRYTNGRIAHLLAIEREREVPFILEWVRSGKEPTLPAPEDLPAATAAMAEPPRVAPAPVRAAPPTPELPEGIRINGLLGTQVVFINGTAFRAGERHTLRLRDRSVEVKCVEIRARVAVLRIGDDARAIELMVGGEAWKP